MSKAKRIGTAAESAVVKYFQSLGVENVTRKVLNGRNDLGDIHIGYAEIAGFMEELKTEITNTYGEFNPEKGYLILKIPGKGKVQDWMLYKFIDNEIWGCRVGDHNFKL